MFAMLKQLFGTITLFISGLEGYAKGFKHIGDWADEAGAGFADEQRLQRKLQQLEYKRKFEKEMRKYDAELAKANGAAPTPASEELPL